MSDPHLILCGGLRRADAPSAWRRAEVLPLEIGRDEDIHLRIDQITRRMRTSIPNRSGDLLEIAAYVFGADQALTRGGTSEFEYGTRWRRTLRFVVPVRCPAVWSQPAVQMALVEALRFLTDDDYEFHFTPATDALRADGYLFDAVAPDGDEFEDVVLFSGGLDSLCGAVEEVLVAQRRVVLVSHRSATRVTARQQALFEALMRRVPRGPIAPLHVGITVNKGEDFNKEFSQRSRSFVFAAMAAVIARLVGRSRIRFYENGITSLNLPVSPELVGARASRTTHPQVLARLGQALSLLYETPFEVQNPFQGRTKAEMLRDLRARGHADLCAGTCSCGHVWGQEEQTPHCGRCSQCVDRRLSALAAGLGDAEDPLARYASDPLAGERTGPDRTFAERYVGMAREIERIESVHAFAVRYPEVNDALPFLGMTLDRAAESIYALYRRHAAGLSRAIRDTLRDRADEVYWQSLPPSSLLGMVLGRTALEPLDRIRCAADGSASGFVVDRSRFEVRFHQRSCVLGNTLEFRLVERLHRARGTYLSIEQLGEDVWQDASVSKNSVQRVACSLRRCFRNAHFDGVGIDGSQPGHYGLVLPPV